MIILNMKIDNIYMFKNFEIDFTFPREVKNIIVPEERLANAPQIRYKKINILMGGNASGKTTLGKVMCSLQNYLIGRTGEFLRKRFHEHDRGSVEMVFAVDKYMFEFKIVVDDEMCIEQIKSTKLRKTYSLNKHLEVLEMTKPIVKKYKNRLDFHRNSDFPLISKVIDEKFTDDMSYADYFLNYIPYYYRFASFTNDSRNANLKDEDLENIEKILKIIDNSIDSVRPSGSKKVNTDDYQQEKDYYIKMKNGEMVIVPDGNPREIRDSRISQGTIEAIDIAYITNKLSSYQGIVYLDEQMAYMHTDLANNMILKMISSIVGDTQLFITTHDENVLDLNIPIHSFTFLVRKDGYIKVENPEKKLNKSDRRLIEYVQNNYFETYPELGGLWSE